MAANQILTIPELLAASIEWCRGRPGGGGAKHSAPAVAVKAINFDTPKPGHALFLVAITVE